jgi:hypothetical protein
VFEATGIEGQAPGLFDRLLLLLLCGHVLNQLHALIRHWMRDVHPTHRVAATAIADPAHARETG